MSSEEQLELLSTMMSKISDRDGQMQVLDSYFEVIKNDEELFARNPNLKIITWNKLNALLFDNGWDRASYYLDSIYPHGFTYTVSNLDHMFQCDKCTVCSMTNYGKWVKITEVHTKFFCWTCLRKALKPIDPIESIDPIEPDEKKPVDPIAEEDVEDGDVDEDDDGGGDDDGD